MQEKRKFNWINLLLILAFLIGLGILLYPNISNYVNQRNSSKAVSEYDEAIAQMNEEQRKESLYLASQYNSAIVNNMSRFAEMTQTEYDEYMGTLNIDGNGMMCYLKIDKLGVNLPVYHGTDESVLQHYVGHVEGTSLPVGGIGTHCALSGHRGLPTAVLFTNLDRLEVGDVFSIFVLGEEHIYLIDQIETVTPDDMSLLAIDPEKDYCTLITCTPYGVNTHRLMVRGVRINDGLDETEMENVTVSTGQGKHKLFDFTREQWVNVIAAGMTTAFGFVAIPLIVFVPVRKKVLVLRPWDDNIVEVINASIVVSKYATRENWEVKDVAQEADWLAGLRHWNEDMGSCRMNPETESNENASYKSYEQLIADGEYDEREWDEYRYQENDMFPDSAVINEKNSQEQSSQEESIRDWDDEILEKVDEDWSKLDAPRHKFIIRFIDIQKALDGKYEKKDKKPKKKTE